MSERSGAASGASQQTSRPVIGILGATGAVGGALARALAAVDVGDLRLGARRPERLEPLCAELGDVATAVPVDPASPGDLERFCSGCRVLVNCVGPPPALRRAVAAAARAAGADYVDPGGDDVARRDLAAFFPPGTAVIGAGVLPGLSGLLPRWLAKAGIEPPLRLTAYVASAERMTPAAATEFLLSLDGGYGEAGVAWRAGTRVPHDLEPLAATRLPFFPEPVVGRAYLSTETERLARSLALDEVRWYHVFDADDTILPVLSRLQQELRRGGRLDNLAAELRRAVEIEMFGRVPTQQLVFELSGIVDGRPAQLVAVLRASSTYELTATVTAAAVFEVMHSAVPVGVHFAAEVLDPALVVRLPEADGVVALHVLDRPLADYAELDHGVV
jgi:NAD(P)-dependent dehydrogenase (short-subunit alcohol dehydrogenase family)